ncbi:hypothetical protein FQR65_LT12296 [Abscondita terminalis]|nr:hypothetical protein FQR65_LT12296 [Abscondita terminalis]
MLLMVFFLCVTRSLGTEDQNVFSKFHQNDYDIKNIRLDSLSYNKEIFEELLIVYRKHNRSAMAMNVSILTRVDLTNNNVHETAQVYRRYGNEYKYFPVRLTYKWCTILEENVLGINTNPSWGKLSCPVKKNVRQSMYNWTPDISRLPPFVPDGDYMLKVNSTNQKQYLYEIQYFATVYLVNPRIFTKPYQPFYLALKKNHNDELIQKMLLTKMTLFFLSLTPNLANEDQNLFSKFYQHDYDVKNIRVESVTYNKEFLEDFLMVYGRHNRTTTMNISLLSRVDLTKNNIDQTVQVYRRYGNEFKYFPIRLSYKLCSIFEENILGFGTNPCGLISCPIRKNIRQSMYNWTPNFTRLPPLVPDGEYMLKINTTIQKQYLYNMQYFGTVYRKVKDDVEVFRRYGNEFKYFPVRLSYKWCTMFEENMLGFGSNPYGKITCPIKKDVRQSMYNWIPDFSRLPPLIPEGEYMVIANATYKNQYLYNMQYFATVYYKIQIPS